MRRFFALLVAAALFHIAAPSGLAGENVRNQLKETTPAELPAEVRDTLALIKSGGPFPHQRDGIAFGNYERRLPAKERGYYREYTVPTPGSRDRGARRIIAGRNREYYYTTDHYKTFRRIRE
jgi:ribonuclease T1